MATNKAEVVVLIKALNKAAASKEPAQNLVDILQRFKTEVKATDEVLRSTKAGVAVNRQTKHPNKEVAKLANEIVNHWKEAVKAEKAAEAAAAAKAAGNSSSQLTDRENSATRADTPTTDPGNIKSENQSPKTTKTKPTAVNGVPLNERSWKRDKVDVDRTEDRLRNATIGLLYDGLVHGGDEASTHVLKRAMDIEKAVFEHYQANQTSGGYRQKTRSLHFNVKNKSNPQLRKYVLSGEITAQRLVVMTHEELKSAERRAEDEKLKQENMNKAMVAQAEKSVSTALTCGKCNQKKVSYSQAQTRSADEPMTTFCECQVCGNRWKFS